METSWQQLEQVFRPHPIAPGEQIDLYHVYDNLSRTPFLHGTGIQCEDPDNYFMAPWSHVITPPSIKKHLNWKNPERTQFISFYDDDVVAQKEASRRRGQRYVNGVGRRDPKSVRVAHVRLPHNSQVWSMSRAEVLGMMEVFGAQDILPVFGRNEWLVWGVVPEAFVINRDEL